jgi:dephospho-CoA kinase
VLLVDAPKELRLTRASLRDGLAKEKIQDRMAAQPLMNLISDGGSCTRVNHVLLNDGSMEDLQHRLAEFMEIYGLTKML